MNHTIITSSAEVHELAERAVRDGRVGIDTEFLWERTYSPLICLVQVNVGNEIYVIDPLDGIDIRPIAQLVSNPDVQVVMHAPHADLVAFVQRLGARPSNIFDTQIAAGFAGMSAGLSYERLAQESIGARVQPSESFSDWSRRPLTEKQLRYAGEDVEHLFAMADEITARLEKMGRVEWAQEELDRRFADISRIVTDPADQWRRVSRRGKLGPKDLGVLQAVAAWRDETARKRDLPSGWIMKDPTLVELARRKPRTEHDLGKIRGIDGSVKPHERTELVQAIASAEGHEIVEDGPPPARMVRQKVSIAKGLATALLRARCEAADIASELVGTSSDVEELIAWVASGGPNDAERERPALLRGWREKFGSDLVDLVDGRLTLRLTDEVPYLEIAPYS